MNVSMYVLAMSMLATANSMAQSQPKPPPPNASMPTLAVPVALNEFTFPAVTFACVELVIPDDEKEAESAIEKARMRWYETALSAGLKQAGYVFIHAKLPVDAAANILTAVPAEACAIVSQESAIQGMKMHSLPARQGLTGFCYETLDVKECLASASKEAGFNSVNPWSWLPIFARWPLDQPIPTTGAEVVRYLSTAVFEIAYALPGSGIPRERSSNGLQPLVECKDCDNPDGPSETEAVGRGIGWFIPLR